MLHIRGSILSCNRLTLGHVYDMDLKKNEALIKEVIIQAQGEVGGTGLSFVIVLTTSFRWRSKNISSK